MTDQALTIQHTASQLANAVSHNQIMLSEKIGALKAFEFTKKLLTVSTIKMLAEVKESQEYKGLQVLSQDGKLLTVSTWEDFCQSIGISRQKVDLDIQNLSTFGEEFLETSQRMGIGYRDLRKLRKLPEDQQEVIINGEAVKAEDKESLIDLIEEMSVKHAKDKQALQDQAKTLEKTIKDLESEAKAKDTVLMNKDRKINELDEKLTIRMDISQHHIVRAEVEAHINDELAQATASVLTAISQFNAKIDLLTEQAGENFLTHLKDKIIKDVSVVYQRIAQVGFDVGVDLEIMMKPDWLEADTTPADIPDFELESYTQADLNAKADDKNK